jgi:hypothetical protein
MKNAKDTGISKANEYLIPIEFTIVEIIIGTKKVKAVIVVEK